MMIFIDILLSMILYVSIGMGIATARSKQIFRKVQHESRNIDISRRQQVAMDAYHLSLAGWVFAWPLRAAAYLIGAIIIYLVVKPVVAVSSWAFTTVKAPVSSVLNEVQGLNEEIGKLVGTRDNPNADDEEKKIAKEALEAAYARQEALHEDLGMDAPMRLALTSSNPTVDRGMSLAQEVLRKKKAENRGRDPYIPRGRLVNDDYWD